MEEDAVWGEHRKILEHTSAVHIYIVDDSSLL